MALDPATLLSRTSAGDAELRTPQNGLSLGQRKLLTYLDQPRALEELAAEHALDLAKLERDLARLAAAGLLAIDGEARGHAQAAVVLGGWRSGSSRRLGVALATLAGAAAVWFIIGTVSHKAERRATDGASVVAARVPHDAAVPAGNVPPAQPAAAVATLTPAADTPLAASPAPTAPAAAPGAAQPAERPKAPVTVSATAVEAARVDTHAAVARTADPATVVAKTDPASPAVDAAQARANDAPPAAKIAGAAAPVAPVNGAAAPVAPVAGAPAPAGGVNAAALPGAMPRTAAGAPVPATVAPKPVDPSPTTVATARVEPSPASAAPANPRAEAATRSAPAASPAAPAPIRLAMAAPGGGAAHPPPASPLIPLSRDDPEFPREAIRNGVSNGIVKARIAVDASGKVSAVTIVDARPPRVFDRAVREALAHWTFAAGEAGRGTEVEIAFRRD